MMVILVKENNNGNLTETLFFRTTQTTIARVLEQHPPYRNQS